MGLAKLVIMLAMYSHSVENEWEFPEVRLPPVQIEGIASWYGGGNGDNGLHGKITATGEVFLPRKRTCASRSIPLNTVVLIEDPETGRRAWCRVNDRGPYGAMYEGQWVLKLTSDDPGEWRGIMDLSRGTAKSLGFNFRSGLNTIRVRYFDTASRTRYAMVWNLNQKITQ